MRKLLHKLFGFEYCIMQDNDGEITISRMREISKEIFITKRFSSNVRLYENGTASKPYIKSLEKMEF